MDGLNRVTSGVLAALCLKCTLAIRSSRSVIFFFHFSKTLSEPLPGVLLQSDLTRVSSILHRNLNPDLCKGCAFIVLHSFYGGLGLNYSIDCNSDIMKSESESQI